MTTQQFWLTAWNWNPIVIAGSLATLFGYAKVTRFRFAARGGCFIAALAVLFFALASPVNTLADGYLFSAHMLQHLLLLLVIPPFMLLGLPEWKANDFHSAPRADGRTLGEEKRFARALRKFHIHPFAAWLAGLGAMWIWHERTLCNFATTTQTGRMIQTVSLITMGFLFWWPIVGPQMNRRLPPLLGVLYLFSACVGCTILGILITFAPVGAVCPVYLHPADRLGILPLIRERWGISAARDQQAGGLMMWVPACGIYISGVIALLVRWYRSGETGSTEPTAASGELARVFPGARTTKGNA